MTKNADHVVFTVLCGQLLCFFKDQEDFVASKAATSPIIVFKAKCEKAFDYTKRKHVFRYMHYFYCEIDESKLDDRICCLVDYVVRMVPSSSS